MLFRSVAEDDVAFDGRMAFTNNTVYVVAYSTDHAKDSDIPESWADFADQRLAGKMATSLYALPRLTAGLAQNWGEERALQFTRDLVQRAEIMVTRGPRDGYLKSGERPIALAELDGLWETGSERVDSVAAMFRNAPWVEARNWADTGHNIEHHSAAREYVASVAAFVRRVVG